MECNPRGVAYSFASVFSRCAAAADSTIDFDTRILTRILKWAQTGAAGDPPEWRQELPYRLAREQAQWNGQPNPDAEVERNLLQVRSGALSLAGTAAFAEKILGSSQLRLFNELHHRVVSVTDRFWANREDRLFNLLVHELFHLSTGERKDRRSAVRELVCAAVTRDESSGLVRHDRHRVGVGHYVAAAKVAEAALEQRKHEPRGPCD